MVFLGRSVSKESSCNAGDTGRHEFNPRVRKIPWQRKCNPLQHSRKSIHGKAHGQRSLVGYSPWGPKSQTGLSDYTTTTVIYFRN